MRIGRFEGTILLVLCRVFAAALVSWDYIGQQLKVGGESALSGQLVHTAMRQSQSKGDWEQMDADALEGKSSAAEQENKSKSKSKPDALRKTMAARTPPKPPNVSRGKGSIGQVGGSDG